MGGALLGLYGDLVVIHRQALAIARVLHVLASCTTPAVRSAARSLESSRLLMARLS